jgi:hypothetical protein
MKVSVRIWSMSSSGYVASRGACHAVILPNEAIARVAGNKDALYRESTNYPSLEESMLEDAQPIGWESGACNYQGTEGIIEVPNGFSVVQREFRDISTRDEVEYSAWVVATDSLRDLYRERSKMYARLAEEQDCP